MRNTLLYVAWTLVLLCLQGAIFAESPASQPSEELKPTWMTVARWYGQINDYARHYATLEPGGAGVAMSSPNSVQKTGGAVVIREEISNFGARRTVVESVTWSSSVGQLYYQNKDGSTVGAGGGGSGSASITEQDLSAEKPKINPPARQSAEQRLSDAQRELDRAMQRLDQARQKVAGSGPDAALSAQPAVQQFDAAVQQYYSNVPADGSAANTSPQEKARKQLEDTRKALSDWLTKQRSDLTAAYQKNIAPINKQLQDRTLSDDARRNALDDRRAVTGQYTEQMKKLSSMSAWTNAKEAVFETSQDVERARRQVLSATAFLDDLGRPTPKAIASVEISKDTTQGTEKISLHFSVQDKKLLTFPVDVIPLKLIGFKTVLNTDYKPRDYTASAIGFGGSVEVKPGTESVVIRNDAQRKSGEPGLIGGGESENHSSFTRVPIQQQLLVEGKVLHRVRVPKDDKDANVILPDFIGPLAPGQIPPTSLDGAVPVAGSVRVEAWVQDAAKPAPTTQPADIAVATGPDGNFQFGVPRGGDKALRLRFTYYSKAARLWEIQNLQVNTNDVLTAGLGAGSSASAPVPNIVRDRTCYYRYGNAPLEYNLGPEPRGATVKRQGQQIVLQFEGLNSILINTFCLTAPYLNQNNQAFSIKGAAVPAARILAVRPSFIPEAMVRTNLGLGDGAAPPQTTTDVKVRGSVVCYPTCVTMVLGGLDLLSLADDGQKSDEVGKLAQAIYDFHAARSHRPIPQNQQPPWVFPLPDDPANAEALMRQIQADLASPDPIIKNQGIRKRNAAAALYDNWPFVNANENDLNKQWLITIKGDTGFHWLSTSTGAEIVAVDEGTYRPWQASDIVNDFLNNQYGPAKMRTSVLAKDVFSPVNAQALINALGRGILSTVSIDHRDSNGHRGGHILVMLGVITDNSGMPLRIIVHDPYGDQTQHPGIEGYYNPGDMEDKSLYDKDKPGPGGGGETKGRYAPYGPEIDSYNGSLHSKYWVMFERPDLPKTADSIRKRLVPSERWPGGEPK